MPRLIRTTILIKKKNSLRKISNLGDDFEAIINEEGFNLDV